jgi:HNH endonuclease
MKEIPLTHGRVAIVDDEDFEWINQWKWHVRTCGGGKRYAYRWGQGRPQREIISMHRMILNVTSGECDHKDGNSLNNRRSNLRSCTHAQNVRNRGVQKNNSLGLKGVCRSRDKFRAYISYEGKTINIGHFLNSTDAAIARDEYAKRLHGEFARLNFQ